MSVSNLAIVLLVIFIVFIIALACELLYVLRRRRSFRHHSSPPPPNQTIDVPTKELLYFFCLKPNDDTPIEKLEPPDKNTNKASSDDDDEVLDVFKMLEAKGPSRFLCTIKEEDKEDVESMHEVDFSNKMKPEQLVMDQEEVVVIAVDESDGIAKTVFSTPCDSPMFFTPAGSPARDFMEPEFTVSVRNGTDMVPCQIKYDRFESHSQFRHNESV